MTRMLDPRIKVMVLLFVNLLMYSSIAYWVEAVCVLAIALGLLYQQQYKDAAISLTGYGMIATLTFLMVIIGGRVSMAIGAFFLLVRKMFPVFMAAKLLIHSPSGQLICALQKWHCPKVLIVSITVILRFFPTLAEEFRSIKSAMLVRGIPLNVKNSICHPAATTEFVLVPLISRLSIVSDELSAAALTRGIEVPKKRTSYYKLRIGYPDVFLFLLLFLLLLAAYLPKLGVTF